jgi:hypothetical protein
MKKLILTAIALFLLVSVSLFPDVLTKTDFLATATTITASTTVTNGTDFTSREITVGAAADNVVGITVLFTRVTGAASTLDVAFEVSYDNGTTWATLEDGTFSVATNHAAITGNTVRAFKMYNLYGVSHMRVHTMLNNWSGGSLTAVNVILTTSRS